MGRSLAQAAAEVGITQWKAGVSELARTRWRDEYLVSIDGHDVELGPHIGLGSGSGANFVARIYLHVADGNDDLRGGITVGRRRAPPHRQHDLMLIRSAGDEVLCIGQASHAWVSGQIARAWRDVGEPREAVLLAAGQHDFAWLGWDAAPVRDPATGLPYSFLEMPARRLVRAVGPAPWRLATQSAYAALLVSMHGSRLRSAAGGAERLPRRAGGDPGVPAPATGADREAALRHRDLLAVWDALSLALCLDRPVLPTPGITLTAAGDAHTLDPWPFDTEAVGLVCEARVLPAAGFPDDETLRSALRAAPLRELRFSLRAAARRRWAGRRGGRRSPRRAPGRA